MMLIRLFLIFLLLPLKALAIDHLQPLGENGIYQYKGSKEFIEQLNQAGYASLVTHIIYPSGKPFKALRILEDLNKGEFILSIGINTEPSPKIINVKISEALATYTDGLFESVLNDTAALKEVQLHTDGTDYVFSNWKYAGFIWNAKVDSKPGLLAKYCENLLKQVVNGKSAKLNDELISIGTSIIQSSNLKTQ